MIARLQKSMQEKDKGFTLIELLVVMIIIGILAAIAIPVFLSQREKARDTATRGDVSTLGKEVASHYVDATAAPAFTQAGGVGTDVTVAANVLNVSEGTVLEDSAFTDSTTWCIAASNDQGTGQQFVYTAANGLTVAAATVTDPCP